MQIAVNGDFFTPWWSNSPFDYYPHVGDSVDVSNVASFRGKFYGKDAANDATLYLNQAGQVSIGTPVGPIYDALSGNVALVSHGQVNAQSSDAYLTSTNPRTAVGLETDPHRLILIMIDGRQPNYSEGSTVGELAGIMKDYGADEAINLDGGGSSALVIQSANGAPVVLNSPIDNRIPGRERAVADHLGIFAQPAAGP